MGFYNAQVLPRVVNVMLGNKEFAKVRTEAEHGHSPDTKVARTQDRCMYVGRARNP